MVDFAEHVRAARQVDAMDGHACLIGFYHRAGDEAGAMAFVQGLERDGWKVLHVSPDEHTRWTKVALARAVPLTPTHPYAQGGE